MMMRRRFAAVSSSSTGLICTPTSLLVASALVIAWPHAVSAVPQGVGTPDDVTGEAGALLSANFKLGPFHLSPLLLASTGMGSVPNVQSESDPERLAIDGFALVMPELRAALPMATNHEVELIGRVTKLWYREQQQDNKTNYGASGIYTYSGPRMQTSVGTDYFTGSVSDVTPLVLEDQPDGALETDKFVSFKRQKAQANVTFAATERVSLMVGAFGTAVRYDEENDVKLTNNDRVGAETSFDFAATSFSTIGAFYQWHRDGEPDVSTSIHNSRNQILGLKYGWRRPNALTTEVLVGYEIIDPLDESVAGYRGLGYSATVTGQPIERIQAVLQASRSTFLSSYSSNIFGVTHDGQLLLTFVAIRRLRFDAAVSLSVLDYPEDDAEIPRQDIVTRYWVGADWGFASYHNLNFGIGKIQRDSTVEGNDTNGLLLNFGYFFVY